MPTPFPSLPEDNQRKRTVIRRERWAIVREIIRITEQPMLVLSFAWLLLIILDLVQGLNKPLLVLTYIIWALFIVDFLLQFLVAPARVLFLKRNWVTALAIALPALRMLRFFQAFRLFRILRLSRLGGTINFLRILTSTRRGMHALGKTLGRRGFGYIFALTTLLIFLGAAGMYHFENPDAVRNSGYQGPARTGLQSYPDALWWTAMLITTIGSEYWPKTPEGRILCWFLSLYAFTVFGYSAATFASHFVQLDKAKEKAPGYSAVDRLS